MKIFQEAITKSFMVNIELLKESTSKIMMMNYNNRIKHLTFRLILEKDRAFIYPFLAVMDKSVYIELLMKVNRIKKLYF